MDVMEKKASKKRLIDVDEAIINFGFEWDDIPPTREEFVRFLKKQSIIDAVPVIMCRDCKFRSSWMMNRNLRYICPESGMFPNGENDFCSYGERKEGAD